MTTRAAILFCLLAGCAGLGLQRQQPGSSSSATPWLNSAELSTAEDKAEQARNDAEAAATAAEQAGVPHISEKELDAKDRRAVAESDSVFKKDERIGGLFDSMEKQAAAEEKVIGGIMHASELLRDHKIGKHTAELSAKLDNADKKALKEMVDAEKQDEKAIKSAKKSFDSQEKLQVTQAKELHKVEKEYGTLKAHMRADRKKLEAAEAQAAKRLSSEAEALRTDACNSTLSNEDVMRLLELSQHDFTELKIQLLHLPAESNTGAWFDDRMDNLRKRSAAASAHMVESIRFKVAEFVSNHLDYSDRQLPSLLARLLNDARAEVKTMMNSSAAIGQRMQSFEQMDPEKMTPLLALAINGVMTNLEFKGHIFGCDTARLDHSTEDTACEALSALMAASMQPGFRSIGLIKESLDSLSKVVPTLLAQEEDSRRLMERRTTNLLDMAYMQQLAYKESAEIIIAQVAPVVMNRLHCAFSGATGLSGLSRAAAAAVALALGWLAL